MYESNGRSIMPPAPDLLDKIERSKLIARAGGALPTGGTDELLDRQTYELIINRPPKTRAHTLVSPTQEFAPVLGTQRAVVLLVDFSDKPATQTQAHYQNMLFSVGTYATGSMRDFYREASYGKVDVIGTVSGWYRAPQPKSYYTNNNFGFGTYPKNAQKLVEDVIALADPHINFGGFDNNGNGYVDAVVVIAAGSGGEVTGNKGDFWSHKWSIPTKNVDGVKIASYFMAPEDGRVGVMAHELGHLLMGWPDLYDTDYSSSGTGRWDLMAGGSWNNGGHTPAHPTAWCKLQAGWVTPTVVFNNEVDVTVKPYAANAQVYKLPIGSTSSKEYFLVSNRQKQDFDAHLPGEGLVIEHVDNNVANNTNENHYKVDIEQCDGKRDLNKNVNRGDATDPFPCSSNDKFTNASTPNSKAYSGSDSKISVTEIKRSGDNITAKINVGGEAAKKWYNKKITRTYSTNHSQNAWAYIQDVGWRRIKTGSADGVTNMFNMLVEARAANITVSVYADNSFIYTIYL